MTVPPLAAHSAPVTFGFVDLTKHFARVQVVVTSDGLTPAEAELSKQNPKEYNKRLRMAQPPHCDVLCCEAKATARSPN